MITRPQGNFKADEMLFEMRDTVTFGQRVQVAATQVVVFCMLSSESFKNQSVNGFSFSLQLSTLWSFFVKA